MRCNVRTHLQSPDTQRPQRLGPGPGQRPRRYRVRAPTSRKAMAKDSLEHSRFLAHCAPGLHALSTLSRPRDEQLAIGPILPYVRPWIRLSWEISRGIATGERLASFQSASSQHYNSCWGTKTPPENCQSAHTSVKLCPSSERLSAFHHGCFPEANGLCSLDCGRHFGCARATAASWA